MSDDPKQKPPGLTKARIALFVLGSILFAVFVGMREQDAAFWIRMLVGGCAFAVIGISLSGKSDDEKQERPGLTKAQIARVVFGLILFVVLLAIQKDLASIWIRMLVAGCAVAVLAIFLLPLGNLTPFPENLPVAVSQSKWMRWCAARELGEARGTSSYPCYRQLFWVGVVCTGFFLLMGAGWFVVAYWNLDGSFRKPREAAFLFAGFWAGWAALGAWISLSAVRSRLNLTDDCLQQVGCFRRTTLRWGHISGVRWRLRPAGGSVVLRGVRRRVTIKFGGFASEHRPEIIQYVHRSISVPVQENWEVFEQRWLTSPGTGPQTGVAP